MSLDTRRLYFYLVCLITLVMVIIGGVQVVNRTLDLVLPAEPYRPPIEARVQRGGEEEQLSREQLEEEAQREMDRQMRDQHRRALRGLFGSIALIGIAGPIYLYHWRRVRRLEE